MGGTIEGLLGTGLVLRLNGANDLAVADGATTFRFDLALVQGARYEVSVAVQPANPTQTCTVENGYGAVSGDVSTVSVVCSTEAYRVGGTISGLGRTGLVLRLGGETLAAGGTSFTFSNPVASGASYAVTVDAQPSPQTCTVDRGSGVIANADVTNVRVVCSGCPSGWCPGPAAAQAAWPVAIWGTGPADVWMVSGDVVHWDGSALSTAHAGWYAGLHGSGRDDVWAVGREGNVAHWDGRTWTAAQPTQYDLRGVWARTPSDVWAVGFYGAIVHWNGTSWSEMARVTVNDLKAVWGAAADDVWAVGDFGSVLHWDGVAWTATYGSDWWRAIWGSGATDVWLVGNDGFTMHWDGVAWSTPDNRATLSDLYGVWGTGPDDVWAVGDDGVILHWDGESWAVTPSGTSKHLGGVWGSGAGDVWAVGDQTVLWWLP